MSEIKINHVGGNLTLNQVPIWIFSILYMSQDIDEIQIGYIGGDDMLSYLDDFQKAYNSFSFIQTNKIPVKFPLKRLSKYDIVLALPNEYAKLVVTCENPKKVTTLGKITSYEPCCECSACKRLIANEYYGFWEYKNIYNDLVKKK